jgi:ring-1,2-phenylacetyl-CoA epoxidase subunit PaaC
MRSDEALFEYLLRLADSDLVLAQRLGEWVGHGPVLEEELASTNVALDLLGQARLWFAYAGEVETRATGKGRTEDELAYLREGGAYRNLLLVEQPNGNYADTMARQLYFDTWHELALEGLARSSDERIAAIAAKAHKEAQYHADRSSEWVIRLGDGTGESHQRMQSAIDDLWMFTGEMFASDAIERELAASGVAVDNAALEAPWRSRIEETLREATLEIPQTAWMQGVRSPGGKAGRHTEHLGHLLAEMQSVHRAHPGARW